MKVIKMLGLLMLALVLGIVAMAIYNTAPHATPVMQPVITNFEECAAAGNAVMESYPRQCRTPDGRLFVEEVSAMPHVPGAFVPGSAETPTSSEGMTFNGCAVAGCSQQLCVSAEEASTIMTTCEFRDEYMCYAEAACEPQADGQCGWTQTPELQRCLANPPGLRNELQVM